MCRDFKYRRKNLYTRTSSKWTKTRNLSGNILCANTLSSTEIYRSNNSQLGIRWCATSAGMKYGYLHDDNTFPYFQTRKANAQYNLQTSNSCFHFYFTARRGFNFSLNVACVKEMFCLIHKFLTVPTTCILRVADCLNLSFQ